MVMFFSDERPKDQREMAKRDMSSGDDNRQVDRTEEINNLEPDEMLASDANRETVHSPTLSEADDLPKGETLDKEAKALRYRATPPTAGRFAVPGEGLRGGRPRLSKAAPPKSTVDDSAVLDSMALDSAIPASAVPEPAAAAEASDLGGMAVADGSRGVQHGYGGLGGFGSSPNRRAGGKAIPDGENETRENRPSAGAVQEKSNAVTSFYFESQTGDAIQRYVDGGAGAVETQQLIEDLEKHTPPGEPLFVVQVDLSPAAVETRAFDQTLLQNTIRLEAEGGEHDGDRGRPASDAVDRLLSLAAAPGEEVVAVVVEATPAQLQATLNDLQADVGNIVNVNVQSNTVPLAAQSERYRNGRRREEPTAKGARGLSRLADGENKWDRSVAKGDPKRPVAIEETDSKEPTLSQFGQEGVDVKSGKKMAGGVAGPNDWAMGRDQNLGRAWVVKLVLPDRNRYLHLGIAAAKEKANSKADAGEPVDSQEDAGVVAKPAEVPFVPRPDNSRQGLPGLQEQTIDREYARPSCGRGPCSSHIRAPDGADR